MNATPTESDRGNAAARADSAGSPEPQAPLLNIANVLTVLRLFLVPVFVVLMLRDGDASRVAATVVFVVAALTDRLDGQLARSRNLVTDFGKIADPIADKALTLSAFVLLSISGDLWWWVTVVVVMRELGITVMRFLMLCRQVMAASRGGKLKTLLQMSGLIGLLVPWGAFLPEAVAGVVLTLAYIIVVAAAVVTLVTGVDYVVEAWRIVRRDRDGIEEEGGEAS